MNRRTLLKSILASPLLGLFKKKRCVKAIFDKEPVRCHSIDFNSKDAFQITGTSFAYRSGFNEVFITTIGKRFPQGVECTHFAIEDFRPEGRNVFIEWNNMFTDWDEMKLWSKCRLENHILGAI